MDDQYRMIEQNIDALLDEKHDMITLTSAEADEIPDMIRPHDFLPYKCLEIGAREPLILGQYTKWSTVESDELNVNHSIKQPFSAPMLPPYNLTVGMMQNILLNFWNAQIRQNMTTTKKTCSFCKKNGMSFATYTSHPLRVNGVLHCPYLLRCQCTHCFKNGHTTSYCPMKERTTAGVANPLIDRNPVYRYSNNY